MKIRNTYKIFFLIALFAFSSFSMRAGTKIIKIKISSAGYLDEIAIRYMPGATAGFDGCCDAWKFFSGNAAIPNLFTRTDIGDELAVNSLPSLNGTNDVDLFVRIGAATTYSITPTQADSFSFSTLITLIDNVTGIVYDLRTTNTYTINLPVIALGAAARFTVHVTPPSVTLPVELKMFTALKEKNGVLLNWSTASEENNESFIVERAELSAFSGSGAIQFVSVGNLPGTGNSTTETNYEYWDQLLSPVEEAQGVRYYRLKQTDYNGSFKYFAPVAVKLSDEGSSGITVYPTVSTGTFFISGDINNADATIYSMTGHLVYTKKIQGLTENEPARIEMPDDQNGIYLMKVVNGSNAIGQKIIINH